MKTQSIKLVILAMVLCSWQAFAQWGGPLKTTLVHTLVREGGFVDGMTYYHGTLYASSPFESAIYTIDPKGLATPRFTELPGAPFGLAFDSKGNLFVNLSWEGQVLKITPSGERSIFAEGFATNVGVAIDAADNVYVQNYGEGYPGNGSQVFKITPAGEKNLYAQGGSIANGPVGLAFDKAGNLYSAHYSDGNITRIYPDGSQDLLTQVPMVGMVGVGYVVVMNDHLYATGFATNQLYEVDLATGVYKVIAGTGNPGHQNGVGFLATFEGLNGLAADPEHRIIYANEWSDSVTGRVRAIRLP